MVLSALVAVAAPAFAHASCHSRKATGAIVGAVGGGLIGNAVSRGNRFPGTLLGAGLGALAGHEIAGAGCRDYPRHAYYRRVYYRRHPYYGAGYGDRYGYDRYRYAAYEPGGYPPRCEMRDQAFYDERGALIYRPVQVCR
jgi:hypothetical protein